MPRSLRDRSTSASLMGGEAEADRLQRWSGDAHCSAARFSTRPAARPWPGGDRQQMAETEKAQPRPTLVTRELCLCVTPCATPPSESAVKTPRPLDGGVFCGRRKPVMHADGVPSGGGTTAGAAARSAVGIGVAEKRSSSDPPAAGLVRPAARRRPAKPSAPDGLATKGPTPTLTDQRAMVPPLTAKKLAELSRRRCPCRIAVRHQHHHRAESTPLGRGTGTTAGLSSLRQKLRGEQKLKAPVVVLLDPTTACPRRAPEKRRRMQHPAAARTIRPHAPWLRDRDRKRGEAYGIGSAQQGDKGCRPL